MADKRINALATTASSTASDDFIAVDGTTNGTRKLNAFSPTFGGNVVVTGTLTSNSTLSTAAGLSCANATITQGYAILTGYGASADAGNLFLGQSSNGNFLNSSLTKIYTAIGGAEISNNIAAGFRVVTTTASTTTSTGALVVGNGTSGGLGVGGSVNIGGRLTVGTTALSDRMFYVSGSTGTTGASQFSAVVNPTIPNTVTTGAYGLYLGTNIAAGATVTNSYSLFIASPDYTGSTVTNKYGLYSNDPNPSYFVGNLLIGATTASTTTSSGALVVSGGVGVAGALNAGSYLRSINSAAANDTEFTALRADVGADGTLGAAVVAIGSLPSATGASRYGFITCSDNVDWRKLYIGGRPGLAASGGQVLIPATLSSTSTSSGALVVSGGVGVAGAIYAGDNIRVTNSFAGLNGFSIFNTNTGGLPGLYIEGDGGEYALIRRHNSTAANPRRLEYIATGSGATHYFNTNTTIAGTITTNAPAGGTAAAWKLGTVATVSPTSPNRTIEVDIGGTIYYLAAKTTNN